jgi:hypothetical protein
MGIVGVAAGGSHRRTIFSLSWDAALGGSGVCHLLDQICVHEVGTGGVGLCLAPSDEIRRIVTIREDSSAFKKKWIHKYYGYRAEIDHAPMGRD